VHCTAVCRGRCAKAPARRHRSGVDPAAAPPAFARPCAPVDAAADGMQAAYAQMQTVDANGFRAFSIGSKPPVIPSLIARC
jgi:hypothetical protein